MFGEQFWALMAAGSFGFMVHHLKSTAPGASIKAGIHATTLILCLFLVAKWMTV